MCMPILSSGLDRWMVTSTFLGCIAQDGPEGRHLATSNCGEGVANCDFTSVKLLMETMRSPTSSCCMQHAPSLRLVSLNFVKLDPILVISTDTASSAGVELRKGGPTH